MWFAVKTNETVSLFLTLMIDMMNDSYWKILTLQCLFILLILSCASVFGAKEREELQETP